MSEILDENNLKDFIIVNDPNGLIEYLKKHQPKHGCFSCIGYISGVDIPLSFSKRNTYQKDELKDKYGIDDYENYRHPYANFTANHEEYYRMFTMTNFIVRWGVNRYADFAGNLSKKNIDYINQNRNNFNREAFDKEYSSKIDDYLMRNNMTRDEYNNMQELPTEMIDKIVRSSGNRDTYINGNLYNKKNDKTGTDNFLVKMIGVKGSTNCDIREVSKNYYIAKYVVTKQGRSQFVDSDYTSIQEITEEEYKKNVEISSLMRGKLDGNPDAFVKGLKQITTDFNNSMTYLRMNIQNIMYLAFTYKNEDKIDINFAYKNNKINFCHIPNTILQPIITKRYDQVIQFELPNAEKSLGTVDEKTLSEAVLRYMEEKETIRKIQSLNERIDKL